MNLTSQPKSLLVIDENDIFKKENLDAPFLFVVDDVFASSQNIMKPHPQRNLDDKEGVFGYRFRQVSNNAFGVLAWRFKLFLSRSNLHPELGVDAMFATIVLHNLLDNCSRTFLI